MQITRGKQLALDTAVILAGTLVLCAHAIYNGFPLTYPDTGTYIAACFEHFIPRDRPLAYAFFIRHISLAATLWLPVIAQSLIVSWLVLLLFRHIARLERPHVPHLVTLFVLTFTTGIAVNTGQLIADVFTPILLLSAGLLCFVPELPRATKIALIIIAIFSVCTHLSHFPLAAGIAAWSLLAWFILRKRTSSPYHWKRSLLIVALIPLSVALTFILNFSVAGKFQFSPGSQHVFMMNRLIQCGIIDDYLDKNCSKRTITLCQKREHLHGDFLWSPTSPLNSVYHWENDGWNKAKPEYDSIISDVFSQSAYVRQFAWCSLRDGAEQLYTFNTGTTPPMTPHDAVDGAIAWHFPKELDAFRRSRQNSSGLNYDLLSLVQRGFILLTTIPFLLLLLVPRLRNTLTPPMRAFAGLTLAGMVINAITVATFAMVDARYQSRLIWLIPLLLFVFLSNKDVQKNLRAAFRRK